MVKLSGILSRFQPINVLVLGDFMVDTYTTGKIRRISPEAPVSVLHVDKEEMRPGGAGNVVLNMIALGAKTTAVGRIGNDKAGEVLKNALEQEGACVDYLLPQKNYQTPIKNRLIAEAQQILRVDFETLTPIDEELEEQITSFLDSLIAPCDVVAVSDYGKGFLSRTLLQKVIEKAKLHGVPIIVDPKGADFSKYKGATVLKPNLNEAYVASKLPADVSLDEVARVLLEKTHAEKLVITRSEAGISLFESHGQRMDFPVRSKEVKDVTGAGDTVLAMLSIAFANHLEMKYAVQLANIAAGMAIEKLGCAKVGLGEVAERLLEFDVENKIFDEEHLFALQKTLVGKRLVILGIESTSGMTTTLFRTLKKLAKKSKEERLILYIRDVDPNEEFIALLASLSEVDFIILQCDSLLHLAKEIHPSEVFILESRDLIKLNHLEEVLVKNS